MTLLRANLLPALNQVLAAQTDGARLQAVVRLHRVVAPMQLGAGERDELATRLAPMGLASVRAGSGAMLVFVPTRREVYLDGELLCGFGRSLNAFRLLETIATRGDSLDYEGLVRVAWSEPYRLPSSLAKLQVAVSRLRKRIMPLELGSRTDGRGYQVFGDHDVWSWARQGALELDKPVQRAAGGQRTLTLPSAIDFARREPLLASPAMVCLWAASEPSRVGELVPRSPGTVVVGRDDSSTLLRQQPGLQVRTGPLWSAHVSRRQLLLRHAPDHIQLSAPGRCPVMVNGVQTKEVRLTLGDVVYIEGQIAFLVCARPETPPPIPWKLGNFGLADEDGLVGEAPALWQLRRDIAQAALTHEPMHVFGDPGNEVPLVVAAIERRQPEGPPPRVVAAEAPEGSVVRVPPLASRLEDVTFLVRDTLRSRLESDGSLARLFGPDRQFPRINPELIFHAVATAKTVADLRALVADHLDTSPGAVLS
jgi:hypothetical protein